MAILTPEERQIKRSVENMLNELPSYISNYKRYKEKNDTSIRTIQQYLYRYRIFFNWLKREEIIKVDDIKNITLQHLENLRLSDVDLFLDYLKNENISKSEMKDDDYFNETVENRDPKSIALMISSLKSLFVFLSQKSEDDETGKTFISRDVMAKVPIPIKKETSQNRAERISSVIIPGDEITKYLNYLECDYEKTLELKQQITTYNRDKRRDIAINALILATGIRLGEVAKILMSGINFKRQTIQIVRKGNQADTIFVVDSAFELLNEYIKVRNTNYKNADKCPFLFVSLYRGTARPITRRSIENIVKKYTKSYFDGNGISPHKLRHSFAVDFVKNGGDITTLRDLLGHTDTKTTSLYLNMANSDKIEMLRRMEKNRFNALTDE